VILQTECIPLEKLTRAEGKEKARRDVGLFPRLPERANSLGEGEQPCSRRWQPPLLRLAGPQADGRAGRSFL